MSLYCCTSYAKVTINTNSWIPALECYFQIQIDFQNDPADAIAALGAASFTSTSNTTVAACMANLVSQINAAATANPSGNPQGLTPAAYSGGIFTMLSFPTPSLPSLCGDNLVALIVDIPVDYCHDGVVPGNNFFVQGGNICYVPPVITSNPFVCNGTQATFNIYFPTGIPANYVITIPNGWTLVSKTAIDGYNVVIVVIPNNKSGIINVSYSTTAYNYNVNYQTINDCSLANCASKMLLDKFCHDTDPCCRECDDYERNKKEKANEMMNKAIGLITTYSLAKQAYFFNCDSTMLPGIESLLEDINDVLIRCQICPKT